MLSSARILATSLFLLLAVPLPGVAQAPLSGHLPAEAKSPLHRDTIQGAPYSSDGSGLTVGDRTGIRLSNAHSHDVVSLATIHTEAVPRAVFSPNGRILASAGRNGAVHLWDMTTKTLQHPLESHVLGHHARSVHIVAFSPNGQTLASVGDDNRVRLWNVASGTLRHTLEDDAAWVRNVAFSPDSRLLAGVGWTGLSRLWNAGAGTLWHMLMGRHTNDHRVHYDWVTSGLTWMKCGV